jgi:Xaa-Pro aminopeptidase
VDSPDYELTPESELRDRIRRFQYRLRENDLGGALICQNADLFYFSGTIQRSFLFIPVRGEAILMTQKGVDRARRESTLGSVYPLEKISAITDLLHEHGYDLNGSVGLELDVIPANLYSKIKGVFPQAELVDVSCEIRENRMIKSNFEISQIKRAAAICSDTMGKARDVIHEGMTEIDLESRLVVFGREKSHHGFIRTRGWNQEIHYGHVLSGKMGAASTFLESPTGGMGPSPAVAQGASFDRIARGAPISIDLCFGVNGYFADHSRTFVIGSLPRRLISDYEKLLDVRHVFEEMASPGVACSKLYAAVLEEMRRVGLARHFMGFGNEKVSFIGHGLGVEVDELPILSPQSPHIMEAGMVFTLEPRLTYPGMGVIGFEDDYVVTARGIDRITNTNERIITV